MSLRFLLRRYAGKIDLNGKISNNSGDNLKRLTCFWITFLNFCGDSGVNQADRETAVCFKCYLDVIFVRIFSFKILSLKAFPQAEPIRLTKTCFALPKMLFTWPRVINAIFST